MFILFLLAFVHPVFSNGGEKIEIRWADVKGASAYVVQLRDGNGSIIVEKRVSGDNLSVELPPGNYQQRVGAINKFQKVSAWTSWKSLKVVKTARPIIDDIEEATIPESPEDRALVLSGKNIVSNTKIQVLAGDRSINIKKIEKTPDGSIRLIIPKSDLQPGDYDIVLENPGGRKTVEEEALSLDEEFIEQGKVSGKSAKLAKLRSLKDLRTESLDLDQAAPQQLASRQPAPKDGEEYADQAGQTTAGQTASAGDSPGQNDNLAAGQNAADSPSPGEKPEELALLQPRIETIEPESLSGISGSIQEQKESIEKQVKESPEGVAPTDGEQGEQTPGELAAQDVPAGVSPWERVIPGHYQFRTDRPWQGSGWTAAYLAYAAGGAAAWSAANAAAASVKSNTIHQLYSNQLLYRNIDSILPASLNSNVLFLSDYNNTQQMKQKYRNLERAQGAIGGAALATYFGYLTIEGWDNVNWTTPIPGWNRIRNGDYWLGGTWALLTTGALGAAAAEYSATNSASAQARGSLYYKLHNDPLTFYYSRNNFSTDTIIELSLLTMGSYTAANQAYKTHKQNYAIAGGSALFFYLLHYMDDTLFLRKRTTLTLNENPDEYGDVSAHFIIAPMLDRDGKTGVVAGMSFRF